MRVGLVAIIVMLIILPARAEVYRWTDSSGNVHFSDQPHKGAKPVELPPVQTYSPPEPTPEKKADAGKPDDDENLSPSYKSVSIVQPAPQSTIRNSQGLVPVVVEFEPKLRKNDKVQLIYDGKPMGEPQNKPFFTLTNVFRGSHTISVQVFSDEGVMINESEPVTFFMHQPRVNMGNVPAGGRGL